jgi:adenine-specific DNA-methyltransferase
VTDQAWAAELISRVRPPRSELDWAAVESAYSQVRLPEPRKRLGQFMTPPVVASLMAEWVLGCKPRTVLDPAVGLGIFPWTVLRRAPDVQVTALDIDPEMAAASMRLVPGLKTIHADFLSFDSPEKFDAVICNPPYVRHHTAKVPEEVYAFYSDVIGERLSRLTNIYALFLIEITRRLKQGGRAAVITPAEYLNADFGVAIKRHLVERGLLSGLIIFDHAAEVFGGALTTASIALIESPKSSAAGNVRVFRVSGIDDLAGLCAEIAGGPEVAGRNGRTVIIKRPMLDPLAKWQSLGKPGYAGRDEPLGDYVRCCRGIATGANHFFTLKRSEAEHFGLPEECLIPCVTKSSHVPGTSFDDSDLARLIEDDKRVLLVDTTSDHPAVRAYLDWGEAEGIDKRYLPAHRNPWYALDKREPAPIWVTVFGRKGFRFIRNRTSALNLTTFHCIYPDRLPSGLSVDDLAACLAGPDLRRAIEEQMRVYGGGLGKLEPRDVLRIRVALGSAEKSGQANAQRLTFQSEKC